MNGHTGNVIVGGGGTTGDVRLLDSNGAEVGRLSGSSRALELGGHGQAGGVAVRDAAGAATARVDGATGTVEARSFTSPTPAGAWPSLANAPPGPLLDLLEEIRRLNTEVLALRQRLATLEAP